MHMRHLFELVFSMTMEAVFFSARPLYAFRARLKNACYGGQEKRMLGPNTISLFPLPTQKRHLIGGWTRFFSAGGYL